MCTLCSNESGMQMKKRKKEKKKRKEKMLVKSKHAIGKKVRKMHCTNINKFEGMKVCELMGIRQRCQQ